MTNNVYWVLECNVNEGELDNFKALAGEMSEATKGEQGAIAYEWFLSGDGATCHIFERYADSAATMVHLGNFAKHFAERFMACVQPTSFNVYGPASDTVRGALADMRAVHYEQFAGFIR